MDILMPQPGETVTEALITIWLKSVGDIVAAGDVLFEIDTDKAAMEVPATAAGTLTEIRVKAGESAPVNAVVACLAAAGEAAAPSGSAIAPGTVISPTQEAVPAARLAPAPYNFVRTPQRNFGPASLPNGIKVTPLARRLAAEKGIDIADISGSGPRGRIVAADARTHKMAPPSATAVAPTAGASRDEVMAQYAGTDFQIVELDGMRRTIARRLSESKATVPHYYLSAHVSIEKLLALRQQVNAGRTDKVSVNDFVVKAFALALQREGAANAAWAEDRILRFAHVDVGVAISVEGGLFTPVIRRAEAKSLSAISAEIKSLADRARTRKLKPADYQGGSATVSNLGMFGVRQFQAIVNPPHATILAIGAGERRPVETEDGGIRFEHQLTATLSVDHRVVDGALGAQLLAAFKATMENPLAVLL